MLNDWACPAVKVIALATVVVFQIHVTTATAQHVSEFITFQVLDRLTRFTTTYTNNVNIYFNTQYNGRYELVLGDNLTLKLNCFAEALSQENQITKVRLCMLVTERVPVCRDLDGNTSSALVTLDDFKMTPELRFHVNRGGSITFKGLSTSKFFEIKFGYFDFYQCQLWNRQGSLRSSLIRIQDFRRGFYLSPPNDSSSMVIDASKTKTFPCFHSKVLGWDSDQPTFIPRPTFVLNFHWSFCSDKDFKVCSNIQNIPGRRWPVVKDVRFGALFSSYIPEGVKRLLQGKRLQCFLGNRLIRRFLDPISFSASSTVKQKLEIIEKKKVTVNAYENVDFSFEMLIQGFDKNTKLTWKMNGRDVTYLSKDEPSEGKCFLVEYSSVPICRGPFKQNFIMKMAATREGDEVNYDFKVIVKGLIVDNDVHEDTPRQVFAVCGSNATFQCRYKDNYSSAMKLLIRGEAVDVRTKRTIEESIIKINRKFSSVMSPLNVDIQKFQNKKGFNVSVKNVIYRDLEHNSLSSSFYAACTGYLQRRVQTLIHKVTFTVLPFPKIKDMKLKMMGNRLSIFYVNIIHEAEIANLGAEFLCKWTFDGQRKYDNTFQHVARKIPNKCKLAVKYEDITSFRNVSVTVELINPTVKRFHLNYKILLLKLTRLISEISKE